MDKKKKVIDGKSLSKAFRVAFCLLSIEDNELPVVGHAALTLFKTDKYVSYTLAEATRFAHFFLYLPSLLVAEGSQRYSAFTSAFVDTYIVDPLFDRAAANDNIPVTSYDLLLQLQQLEREVQRHAWLGDLLKEVRHLPHAILPEQAAAVATAKANMPPFSGEPDAVSKTKSPRGRKHSLSSKKGKEGEDKEKEKEKDKKEVCNSLYFVSSDRRTRCLLGCSLC